MYKSEHKSLVEKTLFKEKKNDTPRIYVADIAAYNEGKLVGEWLNLDDYSSGKEVMKAIDKLLQKWSKKAKVTREEYAIHDVEGIPNQLYSELMGEKDFDSIIDTYQLAEDRDLPFDVLIKAASEYLGKNYDASDLEDFIQDQFVGVYDDEEDLVNQWLEEGLISEDLVPYHLFMSPTDIRVFISDEEDSFIRDREDQDEYIDENELKEFKDDLKNKLEKDPLNYFIDELGYDEKDLIKEAIRGLGTLQIDTEGLFRDLDYSGDFDFITYNGNLYVFRTS